MIDRNLFFEQFGTRFDTSVTTSNERYGCLGNYPTSLSPLYVSVRLRIEGLLFRNPSGDVTCDRNLSSSGPTLKLLGHFTLKSL